MHLQSPGLRWLVRHSGRPVREVRDQRHGQGAGQDAQADCQPGAEWPRARGGRVMNGPVEEIRRLRGELAERDQKLAELRGLVQAHMEATSGDEERALERERAAYERGERDGDEMGWRRGVEYALMAVDDAHMEGNCHDEHGQMRSLKLHSGPVPKRLPPEERVAQANTDGDHHPVRSLHEFP